MAHTPPAVTTTRPPPTPHARPNRPAVLLLAGAVGLLPVAALAHLVDGPDLCAAVLRTTAATAGCAVVAWALTCRRARPAQLAGWIAAGALGLGVACVNFQHLREDTAARRFLAAVRALDDRDDARAALLAERFARLPLAGLLTPARLSTPGAFTAARKDIARFRALVGERHAMAGEADRDRRRLLDAPPPLPAGQARDQAMARLEGRLGGRDSQAAAIEVAQRRQADSREAMLDWLQSVSRAGELAVRDERFLFANDRLLARHGMLAEAVARADDDARAAEESLRDHLADLQDSAQRRVSRSDR